MNDWDDWEEPDYEECSRGRGRYNANQYNSCYTCFLERHDSYIECIWCGPSEILKVYEQPMNHPKSLYSNALSVDYRFRTVSPFR
jgi:hypothetical protein